MVDISVLMSVYNEDESQIELAIKSILTQSYSNFELIIINDNPQNSTISKCLNQMKKLSPKIKIYSNHENMGLALSMNEAFKLSKGRYIARMDADDISFPSRFEKQIKVLEGGSYDFVFTNYDLIDEEGNIIKKKTSKYYDSSEIANIIYKKNIIHHPTVMMSRKIFEEAGGYRNFPCAQDYDFWLRLLNLNCRFYMINEVLFQYRIRGNSTTFRKKVQQQLTLEYSRKLLLERLRFGKDSYSFENYTKYIENKKLKNKKIEIQLEKGMKKLSLASERLKKRRYFSFLYNRIIVFLGNSYYRNYYLTQKKMIIKIKYYLKKR